MRPFDRPWWVLPALLALWLAPCFARSAESGAPVREQMRRYLAARLEAELGLPEARVQALLPLVEALERVRADARRERLELVRELRRGLAQRSPDAELEARLRRLDEVAMREAERTRLAFAAIDRDLTVRQRVQMRFVVAGFRGDVARRVDEMRGGDRRGGGRIR